MRIVTPLLVLAVLLVPGVVPAGVPGQDDAGSGRDAPDEPTHGVLVGEGVHAGRLVVGVDGADHYTLAAPPDAVIRLWADAGGETIQGTLTDGDGVERDWGVGDHRYRMRLDAVARPEGGWRLGVMLIDGQQYADAEVDYVFSVTYDRHTHAATFELPVAPGHAFRVPATGSFARVEILYDLASDQDVGQAIPTVMYEDAREPERTLGWSAAIMGWRATGPAGAWVDGAAVADVDADVRLDTPTERAVPTLITRVEETAFGLRVRGALRLAVPDAGERGVVVHGGLASVVGVTVRAHAVWDAAETPVELLPGTRGVYARLNDTTGDLPAAQVGPVGVGMDRESRFTLGNGSRLVAVDAWRSARLTVEPPGEDPVTLDGGRRTWVPEAAPAGEWRVRVERAVGQENDHYRVFGAEFPFPPPLPIVR